MSTLVSFHAHPDDEAIATGGTLAKVAAEGHRVVVVFATRGEHGEVDDGVLDPGEELWQRRVAETHAAAALLGVARVEFLGYLDSGMVDTPENKAPGSFWQADVDEAADRLAAILAEEGAQVLTIYDERGNYGHPDHIQVHRVGLRAAEGAGVQKLYMATANRDHLRRLLTQAAEFGIDPSEAFDPDEFDLGVDEGRITATVDVHAFLDQKRASMAAHASQIGETSFFLSMPAPAFAAAFGTEWFIRVGGPTDESGRPVEEDDLMSGLE